MLSRQDGQASGPRSWPRALPGGTSRPCRGSSSPAQASPRVTNGPGSRAAGVAIAFKLIESAQTRWQAVNAPRLVAPVRAGAVFKNGKLVERLDGSEGGPATILFARAPGVRRRP